MDPMGYGGIPMAQDVRMAPGFQVLAPRDWMKPFKGSSSEDPKCTMCMAENCVQMCYVIIYYSNIC